MNANALRQFFDAQANQTGAASLLQQSEKGLVVGQDAASGRNSGMHLRTHLKIAAKRHAQRRAVTSRAGQPSERYAHLRFSGGNSSGSEPVEGLAASYEQLYEAAGLLAAGLYDRGLRRGRPLVMLAADCFEWPLLFWAAARIGAPFVSLDPELLSSPARLQAVLQALGDDGGAVVFPDPKAMLSVANDGELLDKFDVKVIASDLAREETPAGWYSMGTLLRIWEIIASSIVKDVDDAARTSSDEGEDTIFVTLSSDAAGEAVSLQRHSTNDLGISTISTVPLGDVERGPELKVTPRSFESIKNTTMAFIQGGRLSFE